MKLQGATALITGAGRGIGAATAMALAREGCNVVVVDNVKERVDETLAKLREINSQCSGIVADLLKDDQIASLVEQTHRQYGRIDILINCAGVCMPRNFMEITAEEWDLVMGINLRAVFIIGQKVMKIMEGQKSGHIINFASSAITYPSPWFHGSYSASKHGVSSLSQTMEDYGKRVGVKVSCILPGCVDTGMTQEMPSMDQFGVVGYSDRSKLLHDTDIADGILFLLKQPNRAMTHNLFIDTTFMD